MARSLWSGTVTFGLVNIPIKLFTAIRDRSIHFHMLTPDGSCRLRRKLYCPDTNKEYDFSEASKGYEVSPGQYIIIDKEQIDQLKPEKGEDLVIQQFVDVSEIDPIYFDRTYYLGPDKGGKRAYKLFLSALEESGKVALGQFVMRNKQHFVVMRPFQGALLIHTLNYAEEIMPVSEIPAIESESSIKVVAEEKKMATQLLDSMTSEFRPEQYRDEYTESIQELLEKAREGKRITSTKDAGGGKTTNVVNLMDALKKSLEGSKKSGEDKAKNAETGKEKSTEGSKKSAAPRKKAARKKAGAK